MSGADGSVPGERLYRLLLKLHTRPFRERYEADMVEMYRDLWRSAAHGKRTLRLPWRWLRLGLATVGAALVERMRSMRTAEGSAPDDRSGRLGGGGRSRPDGRMGGPTMEGWTRDARLAVRNLRKRPAFAAAVLMTLALGLGANTAVFTVFHGVMLAPLPWDQGDRLVRLYNAYVDDPTELGVLSWGAYDQYRENLSTLDGLVATDTYRQDTADLTDGDRPERVKTQRIGSEYFDVLGTDLLLGRSFRRSEERADAPIAIVSARVWERYLGGDPAALGRSLTVDGSSFSVVGVVPHGFRDPVQGAIDVFLPQDLTANSSRNNWDNHYLTAYGRLAPGVTLEQARAELSVQSERNRDVSSLAEDEVGRLVPLRDDLIGSVDRTLWILMGAVAFVLLIACVNVASLQLARGTSREPELAVRSALGSGRGRLVRQMLLESLILAVAGGVAGLVFGGLAVDGLVALAPADLSGLDAVRMNPAVFGVGLATAVLAALLFGLGPALRFSRVGLESVLREGSRGGGDGRGRSRLRDILVVSEVALALMLLVGAGLLGKSFHRMQSRDLGIDPEGVLTFQVNLPESRYDPAARARFHVGFQERLRALPSAETVGATSRLPVTGSYHSWGVFHYDEVTEEQLGYVQANQRVIEGEYFDVLKIPLLRGRTFDSRDGPDAPGVVVVSRSLAEAIFPNEDALGKRIRTGGRWGTIVGIVGDVPVTRRGENPPHVYHAHAQFAANRNWPLFQVVSVRGDPGPAVTQARSALAEMDPYLVLYRPEPLTAVIGGGVAHERFALVLLGSFAAVALLLALVGVYGVLADAVGRRRREIGVRIALGAGSGEVLGMVLRRGAALAGLGCVLGLAGAYGLTRVLESLVYEVEVTDPAVFGGVALGLVAVAVVASLLPALQATRVDPVESFRSE